MNRKISPLKFFKNSVLKRQLKAESCFKYQKLWPIEIADTKTLTMSILVVSSKCVNTQFEEDQYNITSYLSLLAMVYTRKVLKES